MTITVHSTNKIVSLIVGPDQEISARIWEGQTNTGIPVHCYITRIAVDKNCDQLEQFATELKECRVPTAAVDRLPDRLIL